MCGHKSGIFHIMFISSYSKRKNRCSSCVKMTNQSDHTQPCTCLDSRAVATRASSWTAWMIRKKLAQIDFHKNLHMCSWTHPHLVSHICVSDLGQHWFRKWLVASSAPRHYLNRCWHIVNWTLRNKLQWNKNQNTKLFIHENVSEIIVCEIAAILSRAIS